jgi:hypothetical protein
VNVLYHRGFTRVKKCDGTKEGKQRAERRKKYFVCVKFSTQVLISLWKSADEEQLTVRPSMFFPGLHHFCASHGARREIIREAVKNAELTGIDVSEWGERFRGARKSCGARMQ